MGGEALHFGAYTATELFATRGGLSLYRAVGGPLAATVHLVTLTADQGGASGLEAWAAHLRRLKAIRHPHLLTFIAAAHTADKRPYIVIPAFPPLRPTGTLSLAAALTLLQPIAAALDYAHEQGLSHGDLRPEYVVRADVGIAVWGWEAGGGPEGISADRAAFARLIRALVGELPPEADRLLDAPSWWPTISRMLESLRTLESPPPVPLAAPPLPIQPRRMGLATYIMFGAGTVILAGLLTVGLLVGTGNLTIALGPSFTPTATNTLTHTPTYTPTETPTHTPTYTPTETATVTLTLTATFTATATFTPSQTASMTPTHTPTATPSLTKTPVQLPTVTLTDIPTSIPTPESVPAVQNGHYGGAKACVSLVGDSVTHGGVTYEVPGTGYIVALTAPLSNFLKDELIAAGIELSSRDRGASHTGISSVNHPSYFNTAAFALLLEDGCAFTFIMPWLNDITPGVPAEVAAPLHADAVSNLVSALADRNPTGRIVVLNYYNGATSPFALNTWAAGFNPTNVEIFNRSLALACSTGGIRQVRQAVCVETDPAFIGLGIEHVIGPTTREAFLGSLVSPLRADQSAWLNAYYAANPNGTLMGDGVHLSEKGKGALARYLIALIRTLPPVE